MIAQATFFHNCFVQTGFFKFSKQLKHSNDNNYTEVLMEHSLE